MQSNDNIDNVQIVVDAYFALIEYTKAPNFDQKKFKQLVDSYTAKYKRLRFEKDGLVQYDFQGHVAENISHIMTSTNS